MTLFCLAASHHDVDLDTVARLSAGSSDVLAAVPTGSAKGAVVLATCNRVEIYAEAADADVSGASEQIVSALADSADVEVDVARRALRTLGPQATARHLFEVGAGLDSAVVGEREIAGQVRRALLEAREAGTATGPLVRLFESATRTAKDIGSQTALGATGRSVVTVALDLTEQLRGLHSEDERAAFWAEANVLLIGTGSYAGTTLAQLAERGATAVGVHSASGRAEQFVADRGGWALPLGGEHVHGAIAEADVIIGSSGSGRQLGRETLAQLRRGAERPLTLVDLALSRDFDPATADLDDVELITLESVRLAAPEQAEAAVGEARVLVDAALAEYTESLRGRTAGEAITALRRHTLATLDEELERVRRRHGCTAAAEEVEFALRRMVKQLLHGPTVRARQFAADGRLDEYERALQVLFDIDVAPARPTVPLGTECPAHDDPSRSERTA
ncbi:glutamyl-tRNA reductase [uncultured Micrococcus sp.]|uniref:glutamyl-tRNA reductase n=1 Tax=uncultured Micrococcus sp. TaxID=114051 RepID=UPI00259472E3|nr:glutamyl-tRNA reductase [uncultured Micrococcus sp.]